MYKKYALIFSLMIVLSGCSTVVTTVDMATTGAIKVVTGTVKGVAHVTTCPFTDKDCF